MTTPVAPKIADEIEALLIAAFTPTRLAVINDSAKHSGHSGDDGSGASHFTVEIESAAFAGVSRLQRQRLVKPMPLPGLPANCGRDIFSGASTPMSN